MLHKEPFHNYIAYPSWANPSYCWSDLPRLLADPIGSGYLEPGRSLEYYLSLGFPRDPQPYRLVNGPVGGGIIMWEGDPLAGGGWKWLPIAILGSEANLRVPPGMENIFASSGVQVVAIEPWSIPFERKSRIYRCGASTEHADSAGDSIYWILCTRGAVERIKRVREISSIAAGFELQATPLSQVPDALLAETAPWFSDAPHSRTWFEVKGGGDGLGYHFAVLVYVAYHLRWVAGPKVLSVHLVANIEGKPNARRDWSTR
jgi:hypothetical protein